LLSYEEFSELVKACTGMEISPQTLKNVGRRILDTERLINRDFGLTRQDDTLPKRYFDDPMPARKTKGHKIDREKFQIMLDEYYAERGWDSEGRVPSEKEEEINSLIGLI
jgi:aldehyde:ferredoxin oxidoreductase